ncbi:hypothetical protein CMI38_06990 [Candidatus Pacearchaeota archaeon]|jgi:hypothetical protein|nr:hypothetical protein [Candidatus Pacearchaeota archaeon]|tara:strand:- start:138 stop:389 length:252 start_codon:yes stop_codon:yes gene_type:complete
MDNKLIDKNILDLKFKLQSQFMNTSLIMMTIGLLTFISTFIWYKERIFFGIALSTIIILISLILYFSADKKIKIILNKIYKLK